MKSIANKSALLRLTRYLAIAVFAFVVVLVLSEHVGSDAPRPQSGQPVNHGAVQAARQTAPIMEDTSPSQSRHPSETFAGGSADHIPIPALRRKRDEPKPAPTKS